MDLPELESIASKCTLCELYKGRNKSVFARGSNNSRVIVCGMCPGRDENNAGSPFVGTAGKVLDTILVEAFGECSSMVDVYITNLVKCFVPPGTQLQDNWMSSCLPYFISQIGLMKPSVLITLGGDVSNFLLATEKSKPMKELRGKVFDYMNSIRLISTYHPSYLARGGGTKHRNFNDVVEDFSKALKFL
jgi:DNA polymerase